MAIKMKTTVTTTVKADCMSHSLAKVTTRDVSMLIDEPKERHGTNLGLSPTETALAALAGCTNTIGQKCAAKLGIEIGNLDVTVKCQLNKLGVMLIEELDNPFEKIELTIIADGPASEEELAQVAEETAKYCAVSKLFLSAGTVINQDWQKAG
ncbi:OsmC family protein [Octadecabacter sp. CECT 8868]|uniref:OsmC family protein n=1 Tax=Octadecabacter algicola TaxID=2909342 RepID=UPI001F4754B4|nr:OsmC family protein [Octadecabacter algicola]MCF2906647.1 OsmC family protein [Octadecabacter algicola]